MMTEEGCRLTPGCWDGGGPGAGVIHDGDLSLSLRESTAPDPSPGAQGLWLGIRSYDCYLAPPFNASTAGHLDIDDDKLDDNCEYVLAQAFAPLLAIDDREGCLAGEPYWAAKYLDNLPPFDTGDMVKLAYLPAYHKDCGSGSHIGDSELIQLTVGYNPTTKHWEVLNSWLSAHVCVNDGFECQLPWNSLGASASWGRNFEWPSGRLLAFPRVWISLNKHANYRSRAHCDAGSTTSAALDFRSATASNRRPTCRYLGWSAFGRARSSVDGRQTYRESRHTRTSFSA